MVRSRYGAIETTYQGYRFRSRLEARWAVFFDCLGESWAYEHEGYRLPSGWYLPDFWLPRLELWLEIKPTAPTVREEALCRELADITDNAVALAIGLPGDYMVAFCGSSGGFVEFSEVFWALDRTGKLCIHSNRTSLEHGYMRLESNGVPCLKFLEEIRQALPSMYFENAKLARFGT